MSRLTPENEAVAHEIISRYPRKKSALIPLLHLAQEQDGYVSDEAMVHLAELVDVTPAEVIGTCVSCHNTRTANGKPPNHIPSPDACDNCHTTTGWTPARQ